MSFVTAALGRKGRHAASLPWGRRPNRPDLGLTRPAAVTAYSSTHKIARTTNAVRKRENARLASKARAAAAKKKPKAPVATARAPKTNSRISIMVLLIALSACER